MRVRVLSISEREAFLHLTYPLHRTGVLAMAEHEVIAVGGDIAGHPIGFAFAVPHRGFYEIGSLHVTLPDDTGVLRRALLDGVIAEAERRDWGVGYFNARFAHTDDSVIRLMRDAGWVGPAVRSVSVRTTVDKLLGFWILPRFGILRRGYQVVPWSQITAEQRQLLVAADDALPDAMKWDLSPLRYEHRAVTEHSFLLLRDGEAIGWHLPERFDADTIRWTCSTVVPGHWSMAAIMPLWDVVLRTQRDAGVTGLIFATTVAHPTFMKFIFRRLLPVLDSVTVGAAFQSRIVQA